MILKINGEEKYFENPVKLIDIANRNYYCAKVNNTIRDLNYIVNTDSTVELLTLNDPDAVRIFEATLRYILVMAIRNLYGDVRVRINYSISMALYVDIVDFNRIDETITSKISEEMQRIIDLDLPINRLKFTKKEALDFYQKKNMLDRCEILKYRKDEYVNIYECDGFYDYMFSHMLPSTGYITKFKLFPYFPKMILQYPRSQTKGEIPEFIYAQKYAKTLTFAKNWSMNLGISNIADLNKKVENESIVDFINVCESRHNSMLAKIGETIEGQKSNIKLVAIAGPSSSGKTTFANRVRIELIARGFKPLMISLDDYYKDYVDIAFEKDGTKDLENIDALDIEKFNNDMLDLILGKEVMLPRYDFKTQKRVNLVPAKLMENSIIIIEGIHALNERLTHLIPRDQKYKIFISPQQQINIDDSNPIRITDIRLIRRTVRDNVNRGYDVEKTIEIWPSVRKGEFKWIYSYQEDADFIFNSELAYELCVLKKYALPLFKSVKRESPNYACANRIVKFLKYFVEIDEKDIPCNSLIREFIGGSSFE